MKAITLHKAGDASHFRFENLNEPNPGKGEVLIKQTAVGVNFFDVCFRRGQYQISKMPTTLGMEGCGVIEKVGEGVTDYKPGERVAYATGGIGAYAEKRVINQHHLVIPPKELTDIQVAGSLFKGLMAHTLLHRVYVAVRAKRILVHAVTGGVGHILCQWAKYLGLEVIGTVGSNDKIAFAQSLGCNHVINYKTTNFVEEISKLTNKEGVGLVYDGIGKDTLEKSLQCLWPMGMCVSFGEASGNTEKLDLNHLIANSLYITRPTLALYKANRIELTLSANEVFAAITKGIIKTKITSYAFKDAVKAHKDLESRATTGSLVLTV
ncbi:MAG: quinone oxidoreductase [Alphaproteobacteria bacterium]|nr:quinone oxidoreductase [Alphaproteobacteria bacterium]